MPKQDPHGKTIRPVLGHRQVLAPGSAKGSDGGRGLHQSLVEGRGGRFTSQGMAATLR